jgi:hypothetical protein
MKQILSVAPILSTVVALAAFLFAVWDGFVNRRRESNRRDWERLQALAQVLHQGPQVGLWAQKLAVQELERLTTKRQQVLLLSKEVLDFWGKNPSFDESLKAELQRLFNSLRS